MNQYRSIYFLHIPKTGGTYFKNNILIDLHLKINSNILMDSHDGWHKKINDSTYVISIFREPVRYICSYFNYFYLKNNKNTLEENKKIFLQFIENQDYFNLQSKFIINDANDLEIFYKLNKKIDLYLLNEKLNRINYIFDNKTLRDNPENIIKKIFNDLNLSGLSFKEKHNSYEDKNSKKIYDFLTKEEKEKIIELNSIDSQIYSQINSNFFEIK